MSSGPTTDRRGDHVIRYSPPLVLAVVVGLFAAWDPAASRVTMAP